MYTCIQYASRITAALLCFGRLAWHLCFGSLVWHLMFALCDRILQDRVAQLFVFVFKNRNAGWAKSEASWAQCGANIVQVGTLFGSVGVKFEASWKKSSKLE